MTDSKTVDKYLALDNTKRSEFLQALSPQERALLPGDVIVHPKATAEAWACAILAGMVLNCQDEALKEKMFLHQYNSVSAKSGDAINVLGDTTADETLNILDITAACVTAVLEKIISFDKACNFINAKQLPAGAGV